MSDEIIPVDTMPESVTVPPAVIEDNSSDPSEGTTAWPDLTDSQKLDILNMKVDYIGQQSESIAGQVAWIGRTFQGVLNMVGSLSPMDLFKMMRGGK